MSGQGRRVPGQAAMYRTEPPRVYVMACATPAEEQALRRKAEAVHARLRSAAGLSSVTTTMNLGDSLRYSTQEGPDAARARWSEAEKSFARLDARIEQRKEREAVFRWLIDAGWLPF